MSLEMCGENPVYNYTVRTIVLIILLAVVGPLFRMIKTRPVLIFMFSKPRHTVKKQTRRDFIGSKISGRNPTEMAK